MTKIDLIEVNSSDSTGYILEYQNVAGKHSNGYSVIYCDVLCSDRDKVAKATKNFVGKTANMTYKAMYNSIGYMLAEFEHSISKYVINYVGFISYKDGEIFAFKNSKIVSIFKNDEDVFRKNGTKVYSSNCSIIDTAVINFNPGDKIYFRLMDLDKKEYNDDDPYVEFKI